MINVNDDNFLTESSLGDFLKTYHPAKDWIPQYSLGQRFKADWFCNTLKLVVEFDGYQHFTSSKQIFNDNRKNQLCKELGISLVRIPYFVQLSTDTINFLFRFNCSYVQQYPHGFISKKNTMIFPADFCELGVKRFRSELQRFEPDVSSCIVDSLVHAVKTRPVETVLPPSCMDLLDAIKNN